MMRPASARASLSCARYSASSCSASSRCDSAAAMSERIFSVRSFMVFLIVGRPNLATKKNTTMKPTAPQMISLISGSSGLGASWQSSMSPPSSRMWMHSSLAWSSSASPSPSWALAGLANPSTARTAIPSAASSSKLLLRRMVRSTPASALAEEEDDEADERQRLDEGDAEEHGRADHAGRLGLAGHGLDRLAHEVADADAGADGAEAVGQGGQAGVVDATAGGFLGQD